RYLTCSCITKKPAIAPSVGGAQQDKQQLEQQSDKGGCSLLQHRYLGEFDGIYDRPLACFGCGIGWACFILGFGFPLLWYIATALYFGKYHLKDPRERAGLAASAIAALICSVAALITLVAVHL
ncbi:hypothetical protein MUK42_32829, partial [Musa troglodytarum]